MNGGGPAEPRVLVTGVGGGGYGEQILKALRLGALQYRVVGGDMNPHSLGLQAVDAPYVLPAAAAPDYLDAVLDICRREQVVAVLPGSEAELRVLSRSQDAIERAGLLLAVNPRAVIELCMDKFATFRWLLEHGFDVPRTVLVQKPEDVEGLDLSPAVVKPVVGGGGSAHLMLAQSPQETRALSAYLLENIGPHLVQEYVGTVDAEFTVGVLTSMQGELVDSIAVRREILSGLSNRITMPNRTGDPSFGSRLAISSGVSQGRVGRFPEVSAVCERLALELGARGALNVQCRLVGERVVVFEINPRFSGTTSIRAMVGFNEPDWLIRRHVLGEALAGRIDYREGVVMRGLIEGLVLDQPT